MGIRSAWERIQREHGGYLVALVCLLNRQNHATQRMYQWKRLFPRLAPPDGYRSPRHWVSWSRVVKGKHEFYQHLPEGCGELAKTYVAAWIEWKRNVNKMMIEEDLALKAIGCALTHLVMSLTTQSSGEARLSPNLVINDGEPKDILASWIFVELLQNPLRESLAGPCDRCGCFFLNRTGHQNKSYCGARCKQTTKKQRTRGRQQEAKLERVSREIEDLVSAQVNGSLPENWKQIVAGRVHVTPKWITRQVSKGRLRTPPASKTKIILAD
jgi:hypothetical protein